MIFSTIWNALKIPPVAVAKVTDPAMVAKLYRHWRWRMFYATFAGYVVFYLMRKNISAAMPAMSRELGYTNTELGILGSTLYLTYGVGKFVNGVIGDRANIRYFSVIGMLLCAVASVAFGFSSSLVVLAFLWGVNGWCQSMGIPPYTRAMAQWFNVHERGRVFSVWQTSHQVGTLLVFWLTGVLLLYFSWRSCFFVPAGIAVVTAFFLINRLRDRPEAMGLPPVERYDPDKDIDYSAAEHEAQEYEQHFWRAFLHKIILNKWIWLAAFINVFIYIVRYGADDWMPKFMVEVRGNSDAMAAFKSSANPLIGIAGMVLAGFLSDKLFNARRGPVTAIFMFLLAASVTGFYFIPPGHGVIDFLMLGLIGFFTYGPQALIAGCASMDFGSKRLAASATGFIGLFGYLGAVASSLGTGVFVDAWGWKGVIAFWALCALVGGLLTLPLWHVKPTTA